MSDHPLTQDLHPPLTRNQATVAAERCFFCHAAPCVDACPTGIDIPMFIRQIATGNAEGAAVTIFSENILGGLCARVCPTETLCEEVCVRNTADDAPVQIGLLQRHATDTLMATGRQPFERAAATGKHVAVVGAGPAGLSCAHRLALKGHQVTLYDRRPKGGGLNEYGIAAYKVIDDFAQRELHYLLDIGGIELKSGQSLGKSLTLDALQNDYDAIFLGIGLGESRKLNIEGEDAQGVQDALTFIESVRQAETYEGLNPGNRVLVIGGGMTAIDAAMQAKLTGSDEVTLVYRSERKNMKASDMEVELAQTNGVTVRTSMLPQRMVSENGTVKGVVFQNANDNTTMEMPADAVLTAIGQSLTASWLDASGMDLENGRIKVNVDRKTSLNTVWAGGDCVSDGPDLSVAAVQDGKLAAESMHTFLSGGQ